MRLGVCSIAVLWVSFTLGCAERPQDVVEATKPQSADTSSVMLRPDPNNPANANNEVPAGWVFRADREDREHTVGADSTADVFFVNMTPGWHVTTGPAGIFYHPASTGEGSYRAQMDVHLFDPQGRREGFGLMFGGRDLDSEDQTYSYFLIRDGGEFLVKNRMGTETVTVEGWKKNAVIKPSAAGETTVLNVLTVDVGEDEVVFSVNGEPVSTTPRDVLATDGIVGFRVNHALSLHITNLSVESL